MLTVPASSDQVIALRVGQNAYRTLVEERGDSSTSRPAYDGEVLEIMAPSFGHDIYSRLVDRLVGAYAGERDRPLLIAGSTTLRVVPRGIEPDGSYYVKKRVCRSVNQDRFRGRCAAGYRLGSGSIPFAHR